MITIGIISGYFNPIHYGHIEYISESKKQCDILVVIVNNDVQVALKGAKKFMDETHRQKIIENIKGVDQALISIDTDKSVCKSISHLKSINKGFDLKWKFFNSGDRKEGNLLSSEQELCKELGIEYIIIDKPKLYSSSALLSQ